MKYFLVCKKVDGFGNDEYCYTDKIYKTREDAVKAIDKIAKRELKEELISIKEDIEEKIKALDEGGYIIGYGDHPVLCLTYKIAEDFDLADYNDFYIREIEVA